jgi:hypothetical protein
MPLSAYVLLAMLSSAPPVGDVRTTLTLGPEVIVQPNGGDDIVSAAYYRRLPGRVTHGHKVWRMKVYRAPGTHYLNPQPLPP